MTAKPPGTLPGAVKTAVVESDVGTPKQSVKVAKEFKEVVADSPELTNATNQEAWWQSGVQWFGTGGVLWGIGVILTETNTHGGDFQSYDFLTLISAIGGVVSGAGVLYRRFVPGLKPLFWRWTQ